MTKEPDAIVHVLLRDIRAQQDEHSAKLDAVEAHAQHVEKQVEDLHMAVTYSLGQSTETQFKQAKPGARIDDLFAQLEKILTSEKPR